MISLDLKINILGELNNCPLHKNSLITGSAGFIGYHLSKYLLARDWQIIGIDNLNNYYDTNLKITE